MTVRNGRVTSISSIMDSIVEFEFTGTYTYTYTYVGIPGPDRIYGCPDMPRPIKGYDTFVSIAMSIRSVCRVVMCIIQMMVDCMHICSALPTRDLWYPTIIRAHL